MNFNELEFTDLNSELFDGNPRFDLNSIKIKEGVMISLTDYETLTRWVTGNARKLF